MTAGRIDDVAVEMRRQTYRYGWLPGYIYAMAKNKPASAVPRPEMLDDRNRHSTSESRSRLPRVAAMHGDRTEEAAR